MSSINHVAIIMDGNGRWANDRGRPRVWGHIRGANRVSSIVTAAAKVGLKSLTLYTFSTENWTRPKDEIGTLFKILIKYLKSEKKNLVKNNIRLSVIGNYQVLDNKIVDVIEDVIEATSSNSGMNLSLAINYGGRTEIVDAVNDFLKTNKRREVTEADISKHLYNDQLKDIDLIIRTAGDNRISNFLLWQLSYAEFYFTETKWPDFTENHFREILDDVSSRERRFGGIKNKSVSLTNEKVH